MKTQVFAVYILSLTTAMILAYSNFRSHFDDHSEYDHRISKLETQLKGARVQHRLSQLKWIEFRHQVATLLPEALEKAKPDDEKTYPLRNLASVVSDQEVESLRVQLAKNTFEKAKALFRKGDYAEASEKLNSFVSRFSYSVHVVEAYFLLSESQFQLRQFDQVIETVERMLNLFPESELTGFALLRMGKVYEKQDRPEEAIDIYQTVLRSFPHRELASQARSSLRSVDL